MGISFKNLNFFDWLGKKVSPKGEDYLKFDDICAEISSEIYVRELAFWSCVNLIGNAISKCEFKTFENGHEVKNNEYYLWNIEPNPNQSSSEFLTKLIANLYRNNEALVFENGNYLYVADSFTREPRIKGDVFLSIMHEDDEIYKSRKAKDVLYFKLHNQNMRKIIDGIYQTYSQLISVASSNFQRQRKNKSLFRYETVPKSGQEREDFDDLVNRRIKLFLNSDSAALPMGKGHDLVEYGSSGSSYSRESSRDIRSMIDDVSDFTAKGFLIPPSLINGSVQDTEKALEQFLTFCIDPLVIHISDEINRKRNGFEGFRNKTYTKIDTRSIKHVDLLSVSNAIDKLISSGAFCINDIRELCGDEIINELWAFQHFITRNYTTIEEALTIMNGGLPSG